MNNLLTRGLNSAGTHLLLQGMGEFISNIPGSYRGKKDSFPFKVLQRGLEIRRLTWKQEEINPMVVVVSIRRDIKEIPVLVVSLTSENIKAKVPVSNLNKEYISSKISIGAMQRDNISSLVNVYKMTQYFENKPSTIFSEKNEFITKKRQLEIIEK